MLWLFMVTHAIRATLIFGFAPLPRISNAYWMRLKPSDFLTPEAVVQLGYPPARIDLLTAIDGVAFDDCFPKRLTVELDDIQLPIIDLESFKANKLASARPKDLADLSELALPDQAPGAQ
jgi:hypothetical protein